MQEAKKKMGADFVIAVDVSSQQDNLNLHGMFELLMQSFDIIGQSLIRMQAEKADVLIRRDVKDSEVQTLLHVLS